jgi:biotin carboxyl carrier protein
MPDYDVLTGSKQRRIKLTRKSADSFTTKVDGKKREIRLKTKGSALGRAFELEIDGKTYRIEFPETKHHENLVTVDGTPFETAVKVAFREQASTTFEPSKAIIANRPGKSTSRKVAAAGAVVAPMTGKVVKIKVKKGEQSWPSIVRG